MAPQLFTHRRKFPKRIDILCFEGAGLSIALVEHNKETDMRVLVIDVPIVCISRRKFIVGG